MESYDPIWPKTIIFWGAGATQPLGFPTTVEQAKAIYYLAERNQPLHARVAKAMNSSRWNKAIEDLLLILGDEETDYNITQNAFSRQFASLSEEQAPKRLTCLQRSYDWGALQKLIQICPGGKSEKFKLIDLFNLLDLHIASGHGFHYTGMRNDGDSFIRPESFIPARNALVMLINLLFYLRYHEALEQKCTLIEQYAGFTKILADLMVEEGLQNLQHHELHRRDFYLFTYAVISLNWDPMLLWLIFNAHKDANDKAPNIGMPAVPMKLFHDMGHFMGVRKVEGPTPEVWYPCNESVVQRMNDPAHASARRFRIGKFYFPHGSLVWRECPSCGKLVVTLGDEWNIFSQSLLPPPLLPSMSEEWRRPRSAEEERAFARGEVDLLQCSYCGTLTELRHTPMIMQSSMKGHHPPFLEEIQRDMRVALERARHIVLMGYSFPEDDFIYRSLLSARQNRDNPPYCSVVGFESGSPDRWLAGEELDTYIQKKPNASICKTVQQARDLFGDKNVRGYAGGIPQMFLADGGASRQKVAEMLEPC